MSLIAITQIIESSTNVTLSAVAGKIQRVVNTGSASIQVTMTGGGSIAVAPGLFSDCWFNGTSWKNTDGTNPVSYLGNLLINGGFDIWQRGESFTNGTRYSADRWLCHLGQVSTSITSSRSTDVPSNGLSKYSARLYAPNTLWNRIEQRIESYNTKSLNGKTVTFSFWAKGDSSNLSFSCLVCRPESQQDTYNPITQVYPSYTLSSAMSASWTQYTYSFIVTAEMANYGFTIILFRPNTANNTFYVTQMMLNEGPVAQPFSPFGGSYISDLQACLRYYEKNYNLNITPGVLNAEAQSTRILSQAYSVYDIHLMNIVYKVTKRIPGDVYYYSPDASNMRNYWRNCTTATDIAVTVADKSTTGFRTTQQNLVNGNLYCFHWTCDAEIF